MVVPTRQSGYQHHPHQGQHAIAPYRQQQQQSNGSSSTSSLGLSTTSKTQPTAPSSGSGFASGATSSSAGSSGTSSGSEQVAAKKNVKEKKRIVYELDSTSTSTVPKRDLAMFDNVFLESIDLQCSKAPSPSSSVGGKEANGEEGGGEAKDDSSEDDEDNQSRVSPMLVCMLEGTLLVRNVAYEKHVSVR